VPVVKEPGQTRGDSRKKKKDERVPRDAEKVRRIALQRHDVPGEEDDDHRADGDRQVTVDMPDADFAKDGN
jgi:hypothetical protein